MTSSYPGPAGPVAEAGGHASADLLSSYAAGQVDEVVIWSMEAHLTRCGRCRSALSAHVDAERLARNRSAVFARAALADGGRMRRLLCQCGVPDHLLRLLAATPSLRRSWLLAVTCVLAIVAGEAVAVGYGWVGNGARTGVGLAVHLDPEVLAPFLLVAPLLVLAGVAAAFLPMFDPAWRLAVAAPFSGFTLLLARSVSALAAALVPVVAAAFVLPGPGWLPVALLLPSLALCAFALAAATIVGPLASAITAGAFWALPVLLLAAAHAPLVIVQRNAQFVCAAVLCAAGLALLVRHDRFELGRVR